MLFNSIEFFIFLPLVILLYAIVSVKYRMYVLLVASLIFYGSWNVNYIFLILLTAISSFYSAKHIKKTEDKQTKKYLLILNLLLNLGILFVFKYFYFTAQVLHDIGTGISLEKLPNIILPIGISFYTFQSLSYVIDVYKQRTDVENNIFRFFLFVTFFPQLVAGPIERSSHLLPQFRNPQKISHDNVKSGVILMLWGLFKKIVIADRLALSANYVFENVSDTSSLALILATLFFTFQIYCDFSGYSDIAIGVARIFGVDLMDNFRRPYFSKSITEFWRRWHISLSTWFRDYVYIPLGGSRVRPYRWIINTMIVFIVSGIWHGANYTFIIWGAIHGLMLVVEKKFFPNVIKDKNIGLSLKNILKSLYTFIIVYFAWIFFRAQDLSEALIVIGKIFEFDNLPNDMAMIFTQGGAEGLLGIKFVDFVLSMFFIATLLIVEFKTRKKGYVTTITYLSQVQRWGYYIIASLLILWFGKFGINEFVYFQF